MKNIFHNLKYALATNTFKMSAAITIAPVASPTAIPAERDAHPDPSPAAPTWTRKQIRRFARKKLWRARHAAKHAERRSAKRAELARLIEDASTVGTAWGSANYARVEAAALSADVYVRKILPAKTAVDRATAAFHATPAWIAAEAAKKKMHHAARYLYIHERFHWNSCEWNCVDEMMSTTATYEKMADAANLLPERMALDAATAAYCAIGKPLTAPKSTPQEAAIDAATAYATTAYEAGAISIYAAREIVHGLENCHTCRPENDWFTFREFCLRCLYIKTFVTAATTKHA